MYALLLWLKYYTKTNAALWYNKICKEKQLQPKYISIRSRGQRQQDKKTTAHAIRFRINQEIRFLYKKKQHLNQQLYRTHLQNAQQYGGMWQHIQHVIDEQLHKQMENQYQKLNRKLDRLMNSTNKQNTQKTVTFQPRIVNLSQTKLTTNSNTVTRPKLCTRKGTEIIHKWLDNRHRSGNKTIK